MSTSEELDRLGLIQRLTAAKTLDDFSEEAVEEAVVEAVAEMEPIEYADGMVPFSSLYYAVKGRDHAVMAPLPKEDYPEAYWADIPPIDPSYIWRKTITEVPVSAMHRGFRTIMLTGPAGSGKTELPRQIAALHGRPFFRVQFHDDLGNEVVNGSVNVQDGSMTHIPSTIERAFGVKNAILQLDEADRAPASVMNSILGVLEKNPTLRMEGKICDNPEDRLVTPEDGLTIFLTGNTKLSGDDSGMYNGTAPQDAALINRIEMFHEVPHPNKTEYKQILKKAVPELKDKDTIDSMLKLTSIIQKGESGSSSIDAPFSLRQLIPWAKEAVYCNDVVQALKHVFYQSLQDDDKRLLNGYCETVFARRIK